MPEPTGDLTSFPEHARAVVFVNQMPDRLELEQEEARESGAVLATAPGSDFEGLVREGQELNYVILESGELVVAVPFLGPCRITHAVLAGGAAVLAAGTVDLVAGYDPVSRRNFNVVLRITNASGHYQPDIGTLELAAEQFRSLGFDVPPGSVQPYDGV